jgi:transposase
MDGILTLGLGLSLEAPWVLKDQHLDTSVSLHCLDLYMSRPSAAVSIPVRSAARPAQPMTLPRGRGGI